VRRAEAALFWSAHRNVGCRFPRAARYGHRSEKNYPISSEFRLTRSTSDHLERNPFNLRHEISPNVLKSKMSGNPRCLRLTDFGSTASDLTALFEKPESLRFSKSSQNQSVAWRFRTKPVSGLMRNALNMHRQYPARLRPTAQPLQDAASGHGRQRMSQVKGRPQ